MKNFKRLTAALSAVTLAATMSISAFAAETTPSISDDKATLNIGTGITTVNGAQTTMMAYVVPGIIGADDTVPAFDATSHTIVALDQVDGTTGIASVPVDANKLADGNSIVVKISGTTGELATYVITMEAQATTYSVTYELDGGSVTGNNPGTFGTEDTIDAFFATLTAPAKVDVTGKYTYTFKGWATSATATTTIDATSTALMTTLLEEGSTTLTLYAIYEEKAAGATVTFVNGKNSTPVVESNGKVTLPTGIAWNGGTPVSGATFTLYSWVTADGTEYVIGDKTELDLGAISEDVTLYAKYNTGIVVGDIDGVVGIDSSDSAAINFYYYFGADISASQNMGKPIYEGSSIIFGDVDGVTGIDSSDSAAVDFYYYFGADISADQSMGKTIYLLNGTTVQASYK